MGRSHQHFQEEEHLTNSVLNNMDYYKFYKVSVGQPLGHGV